MVYRHGDDVLQSLYIRRLYFDRSLCLPSPDILFKSTSVIEAYELRPLFHDKFPFPRLTKPSVYQFRTKISITLSTHTISQS
jgi:hypothetical protein